MCMLLITCMLWCELKVAQSVAFTCEPWSCRNMVLFYVQACITAPGSADLAGSLDNGGKQTAKGLLS